MADTQNEKEDTRQWFLRIGGETVFGPVSTQGLIVWAEQGRILPGHEVSTDRKKWVQAVSVDLLDMRWFVDDGQGELRGPLNRLAAEALLKSGKVSEGAQLVSAEEVETDVAGEQQALAKRAEKPHDPLPEEVLRQRVRELESMVGDLRERLSKLSDGNTLETIAHERDVLVAVVKEAEAQRDAILRNAEKDSRANERKQEALRQQIKKLEQQLEDAHSRLVLSDAAAVTSAGLIDRQEADRLVEEARREAAAKAAQEQSSRERALLDEIASGRVKLDAAEQALREVQELSEREKAARAEEAAALAKRVSELEHAVRFHERKAEEMGQIVSTREAELVAAQERFQESERLRGAAEESRRVAENRARESEAAFAELLNDANARDNANQEKIAGLEKLCAQPPEETARFYADQAAVYELVKAEVDEIAKTMEVERTHVDQLKEWSAQRLQKLLDRRQSLLKYMGGSPGEMTRRAVREQPSDAQAARLRAELENLRVTYQREMKLAETRDREYQDKIRVIEAESSRLQGQATEGEKRSQLARELEEVLRRREQELSDERKTREAEREQFLANQQALLMRIETLEKAARPSTPDEIQTAEARNVKLASWMRLKQ